MEQFERKKSPEEIVMRREARVPIEERQRGLDSGFIERLIENADLIDELREYNYPEDSKTCDEIGKRHGLSDEQIRAASQRLRERDQAKGKIH